MISPFTFILGAVNIMFGNTVCRGWAKAYWLSERSMSSHRGTWGGSEFFCSEASMVLDFVMQRTEWCAHGPWPTAEITAPSLKVCLSPDLLFPFSLSWETKPCAWAIFQRTHILSWLKKKKKSLRPWRGACLLKTPLKALSASFLSVSCQNGCNLNFTTVKFISCPWCCPDWLYHTHMLVKW